MSLTRKILIVDDHVLFTDALQFLLGSLDGSIAVDSVVSLAEAMARLDGGENYNLILLDYTMPETSGLDGMAQLRTRFPDLSVAFLSGAEDGRLVAGAMDMGAAGWISKSMGGAALISALNLLLAGEKFAPAHLLRQESTLPLTEREKDVAALLAQGLADKQIAERLGLQTGTVKVHVKSLLRKSGAENRTKFALLYRGA